MRGRDTMQQKQQFPMENITKILVSVIIAAGLVIAAVIFSGAVADRPLVGSFSGSLSQYEYAQESALMDTEMLRMYLSLYPTQEMYTTEYDEEGNEIMSGYDLAEETLRTALEQNITGGAWHGFPYVRLDGRLYFSKQAVDDWFYAQANAQFTAD